MRGSVGGQVETDIGWQEQLNVREDLLPDLTGKVPCGFRISDVNIAKSPHLGCTDNVL